MVEIKYTATPSPRLQAAEPSTRSVPIDNAYDEIAMRQRFAKVVLLVLTLNLTAVGLGVLVYWYAGVDLFREGSVITIASVVQLATITRISMKIMQAHGGGRWLPVWREPRAVWWATSLGFAFLAADDLFKIHENIDSLIHYAFASAVASRSRRRIRAGRYSSNKPATHDVLDRSEPDVPYL